MWQPISLADLYAEIYKTETLLHGNLWNFWSHIKIEPEKWQEPKYGNEGGGFWVVAVCGKWVIWFNDIEDGFNISSHSTYGTIDEYWCNQDQLNWAVSRLHELMI